MSLNPSSGTAVLSTMKVGEEFILNGAAVKAPLLKKVNFADKSNVNGKMMVHGHFAEAGYSGTKVSTLVPRSGPRHAVRSEPHVCDDLIFDSSTDSSNSHTGNMKRYKKNLLVKKNLQVDKSMQVQKDLQVCKTLTVGESSQIDGNVTVCGDLVVNGKITNTC